MPADADSRPLDHSDPSKSEEAAGAAPAPPKVQAVEFIRRMRGASQPFLMRCDDGRLYVVKFRNNPQHVRILANEMLAAHLARLIELPVPASAMVDVPESMTEHTPQLRFEVGGATIKCEPGLHFGSRFPESQVQTLVVDFLPDRLLRRVHDLKTVFLGAYVLDKWTCNCDGRQVVFCRAENASGRGYSAALIDHGFCFNDGEWNFPDSEIRSLYPRRLVYEGVRNLHSFEPYLSRIENISREELEAGVRAIPADWCGDRAELLPGLIDRLFERRRRVRQLIIDAKNGPLRPFPNWR